MNKIFISAIALCMATSIMSGCTKDSDSDTTTDSTTGSNSGSSGSDTTAEPLFTSYSNMAMIGYQGWFNTEGDGMGCNWTHYSASGGVFEPGRGNITIEFWPDMAEYKMQYITPFSFEEGQFAGTSAYLFSSADYSTTDLHFQWMEEYGLDGVFLQRFLSSVLNTPTLKNHRDHVTGNVIRAAADHGRAWSLMYDLSGSKSEQIMQLMDDLEELDATYQFSDPAVVPNYLHHNGKPMIAIWGAGFDDDRDYSVADVRELIDAINEQGVFSILLGVPYYWRSLERDTVDDPEFHELIKECDMIMPWAVGRYKYSSLQANIDSQYVAGDVAWCEQFGVDYAPLVFPGTSTGNLNGYDGTYDGFPREKGNFFWEQVWNAHNQGATALYVAMFDEVDEGTAIFKCLNTSDVPANGDDGIFVGIDDDLQTDHYLWLAGEATKLFHGDSSGYSSTQPTRE